MVRLYSPKLVALVNQDNGKYSLGIDLAKHCIEAGLNATYVAEILGKIVGRHLGNQDDPEDDAIANTRHQSSTACSLDEHELQ